MNTRTRVTLVLIALGLLGAGNGPGGVRLDNWESYPAGRLDLGGTWRPYPSEQKFKHAPAIVRDGARSALWLKTDDEPMRIGRVVKVEPRETPWLTWEWKVVVLPTGGDLRDPRRNDQAARVMVMFDGMKGLLYVWDTTAPVGAETQPDTFEIFRRALIVVRSGPHSVGQWDRQRRNVYADYRRIFDAEPRTIKWIGLESHSNDTHTRTEVLFGGVRFDAR
ncbi:MAG TPA: DUF3047 domain-containing protein [Methylomirabilota bacterium]|jgi:hypothetical protein